MNKLLMSKMDTLTTIAYSHVNGIVAVAVVIVILIAGAHVVANDLKSKKGS